MIFCTSACLNHLAKTQVLAHSLKKHMPHSKLVVCLIEKSLPPLSTSTVIDEIVLAKDMGHENFESTIFKYNQYEASCFCKGPLLKYVYNKYSDEKSIIYIDSDTKIYSEFTEMTSQLSVSSIIFSPHFIEMPPEDQLVLGENPEILLLRVGVVNGGFIGFSRGQHTLRFLNWWIEKLERHAFQDEANGLFTDQKWLTAAIPLFDNIHILKHKGYNLAFWNFSQYKMTKRGQKIYIDDDQLRFIHYSHAYWLRNVLHNERDASVLSKLLNQYIIELETYMEVYPGGNDWSYNCFDNGEEIHSQSRIIFKNNPDLEREISNPFSLSNSRIFNMAKK